MKIFRQSISALIIATLLVVMSGATTPTLAAVPGGTLDPNSVPKYVTPLVIPPVMPTTNIIGSSPVADYDIAVRQFRQQILPGGIWNLAGGHALNTYNYPATTVWSYGSASDPLPDSTGLGGGAGIAPAGNSSFNYPAFTVENITNDMTKVRWINELVQDPLTCFYGNAAGNSCDYLPHLLPVDQTLHWANPSAADCLSHMPGGTGTMPGTDCETLNQLPYMGPVPIVTHVHGAHVNAESDGYPEAWWLADAKNIPGIYALTGKQFGQWAGDGANSVGGSAFYAYENTQDAATLWYHDHSMGMTRLNVYAGPAGFWLIRGGAADQPAVGTLPGPAPAAGDGTIALNVVGDPLRNAIREIPIAIQDRSFDWVDAEGNPVAEGDPNAVATKLWYPGNRADFDGYDGPFLGDPTAANDSADISKIWNPEAFFNTFVVNGVTWPSLNVAQERYRFRLLNGCNSRTLNIAMQVVSSSDPALVGTELPFFQIGGDQGLLPAVTMIKTGVMTQLIPGQPLPVSAPNNNMQALLLMPAERADVIVDFTGIPNGTRVRIINTAGDGPFAGLDPADVADPATTGQVMEFVVDASVNNPGGDPSTAVTALQLPAKTMLGAANNTRKVSLNEMVSDTTCIAIDAITGEFVQFLFTDPLGVDLATCEAAGQAVGPGITGDLAGPRQALLGSVETDPGSGALIAVTERWIDPITTRPEQHSTEVWEIYNATMDAHPIHVHLVRFEIVNREDLSFDENGGMFLAGNVTAPRFNELGFKDTVVAFPGQVTRLKAKFDLMGLYVWHCHIVEHEDNEMMLPFEVVAATTPAPLPTISASAPAGLTYDLGDTITLTATPVASNPALINLVGFFENGSPIGFDTTAPYTYAWTPATGGPRGLTAKVYYDNALLAESAALILDVNDTVVAPAWITVPATSINGNYVVEWAASDTLGVTYTLEESDGVNTTLYSGLTTNTYNFAGKFAGTYTYQVQAVKTSMINSTWTPAGNEIFIPISVSLSSNPISPVDTGVSVDFTANLNVSATTYEYRFWLAPLGGGASLMQDYSANNTWTWNTTGKNPGDYQVIVHVRAQGTTTLLYNAALNYTLSGTVVVPPAVSLSTVLASPQATGTSVEFTANLSNGGATTYEYRFWLAPLGGGASLVQDYSANNTWTWNTTGKNPGDYQVIVHVRAQGTTTLLTNATLNYTLSGTVTVIVPPTVSLSTVLASPQATGTSVEFTANLSNGGATTYEYRFWLAPLGGGAVEVQAYSTNNKWIWNTTGKNPGDYQVIVHVRAQGTTTLLTNAALNYTLSGTVTVIVPPTVSLSTVLASPQAQGASVEFTANLANGGATTYEYRFWLAPLGGGAVEVQAYSTNNKWTWNTIGKNPGDYQVIVHVRALGSTTLSTYSLMNYTVSAAP